MLVRKYRLVLSFFILALLISGVTAFPLTQELSWLASFLGLPEGVDLNSLSGIKYWVAYVRAGLQYNDTYYPFMAYGTDWLAFGHIAIALFFLGPYLYPERDHEWTFTAAILACLLVIPVALICGGIRGIPWEWRLMDCCFGVFGLIPLFYLRRINRFLMEQSSNNKLKESS